VVNNEGTKRLELLAPLVYIPDPELLPFPRGETPGGAETAERLFWFALDEAQGRSIEPDPAVFLGPPGAGGYLAPAGHRGEGLELPRGRYLFAQERGTLDREGVTAMAIEIQKDGLWERLGLEGRVYLRYLYEDGGAVTQVFRPYREPAG
jgi:hypothetical protein